MHHDITSDHVGSTVADFCAHVDCDMQLSKLGSSAKQTTPLVRPAGPLTARQFLVKLYITSKIYNTKNEILK